MDHLPTREAPADARRDAVDAIAVPGVLAVHCGRAVAVPFALGTSIGRATLAERGLDDDLISRDHFVVESTRPLAIVDRGSRNGTFVDGERIAGRRELPPSSVVRAGRTLFIAIDDCGALERSPTSEQDGWVAGPATAAILHRARALGRLGHLLVTGPSGSGKELVARAFHDGREGRPFVAVSCATLPAGIAERLLFGAKRGAYTSADQDAVGFVRAAEGGTLFLDEVAELDPAVQAKLLRFLETREYFPVGDTRALAADVRMCFATLRDLEAEVAAKRFREDLYHRIASPSLRLAPLAARREEIPFLVAQVARRFPAVVPGLDFLERALMLPWPGNVRELLRRVEAACVLAEADGRRAPSPADLPALEAPSPSTDPRATPSAEPSDEEVRHAMEVCGGNVSMAARALGVHRSKLRRALTKLT